MRKALSPVFFVLALAVFFLPFVAVSCNVGPLRDTLEAFAPEGEEIPQLPADGDITLFEASGFDVLMDDIQPHDDVQQLAAVGEETVDPEDTATAHGRIWVILAVVAAAAGIVLSLLPGRLGPALALAMGVLGAIFLGVFSFAFRSGMDRELAQEGGGLPGFQASQILNISYGIGYWLALVFFLAAAAIGAWRLVSEREPAPAAGPPGEPFAAPPPGPPPSQPPPPPGEPMGPPPAEPMEPPPTEPMGPPPEPGGPPPPGEEEEPPRG